MDGESSYYDDGSEFLELEEAEEDFCPHCGKNYYEFSDLGCGHCDRRSPEWGTVDKETEAMKTAEQISDAERAFIERLDASLDQPTRLEFGRWERVILLQCMRVVGLTDYPPVIGDPAGERVSGDCICDVCGKTYFVHPPDWRAVGYGNVPFLDVLCDGRRVKL